jgi:DNA repair/transcription protein MET18/MMS19
MALLEQNANAALKSAEANSDATAGLENLNFIYAIVCGIVRRYSSKKAEGLLKFVRDGPAHPTFGAQLAQRMGMLVAPHPYLTKTNYAVVKPLWMQRVYFELVGPMLKLATDQNAEATVRTNFSVAVVLMLRHMTFSIYEADADQVVRITISTAQSFGSGKEALAALDVLQNILLEAPEKGQDHLRSIINICVPAFTSQQTAGADTQQAAIGKLALEIVGGLPKMYEARRLVQFVPRLERELTLACGHGVRDLRRLARLARQAWAPLK